VQFLITSWQKPEITQNFQPVAQLKKHIHLLTVLHWDKAQNYDEYKI